MTSKLPDSPLKDERSGHEFHGKLLVDPDVIHKAALYDSSVEFDPIGMHFAL